MDDKAKEASDWLVRVMNEAETLPVATNLDMQQTAYLLAADGMSKREILFHFVNELFFTTALNEPDNAWDMQQRTDAGLYTGGKT